MTLVCKDDWFCSLQTTGNLLVAGHKTLTLYHFRVCTHDISRLRFIDFEDSGVYLDLIFSPTSLSLAEDIIACMADEFVHVLRLGPRTKTEDQMQESKNKHANGENLLNVTVFLNRYHLLKTSWPANDASFLTNVTVVTWVVVSLEEMSPPGSTGSSLKSAISWHMPLACVPETPLSSD
jgi:hypothetical protein